MNHQASGHEPSSTPTRGEFVAHGMTVWNADSTIEVARCVSRQLCPAGNAANARKLAHGTEALALLDELVEKLSDGADTFETHTAALALLERAGLRRASASMAGQQVTA